MTFSGAPVQTGLVESFARPGGNVTGVTSLGSQLSKRRLELLTQILPAVSRVAILWNPSNPDSTLEFAEACAAAQEMGLLRQSLPVQTQDNIDSAFAAAVAEGSDAMLVLGGDDLIFERRRQVTSLATANGLPSMYESRRFVDDGGLMAYGPSFPELYSSAAVYVDEILKGAPAADLPVKQPTCLRLALNLQTAGDLSLDIAPSAIVQADDVVR